MAGNDHHDAHGQSVASWTAVTIMIVASFLLAFGVGGGNTALTVVGAVLFVVGAIAGKVLAMAGFGVAKPDRANAGS